MIFTGQYLRQMRKMILCNKTYFVEELSQIQERRRPHTEDIVVKEPEYDPAVSIQTPETEENDGDGYDKEENTASDTSP